MSATIGRDHIVDLVVGNRRPYSVHINFVVVGNVWVGLQSIRLQHEPWPSFLLSVE